MEHVAMVTPSQNQEKSKFTSRSVLFLAASLELIWMPLQDSDGFEAALSQDFLGAATWQLFSESWVASLSAVYLNNLAN